MTTVPLPHADFFDSVEPLDACLERAASLFYPAPALSASLPSFLMWQDEFAYALAVKGPFSFMVALYGRNVYMPAAPKPLTPESLAAAFDYLRRVNGPGTGVSRIEGITQEGKKAAEAAGFPVRPALVEYLYDRSRLAGLRGDPYRAQRAGINRLVKEQSVVLRPFRKGDLKACGDLFEVWKNRRLPAFKGGMGEKMLLSSQKAHLRALLQGVDGGMDAWVLFLGDRLAAYSAGAPLGPDTYGIYLEATDLTVKGLSAYIFANICRQLEPYTYINTGDAEGLPRLAESKEHWHPARRLQLYAVDPPA